MADQDKPKEFIGMLHYDGMCFACGLPRTDKGHDPCIANLPGVKAACCGHGIRPGYIFFENGVLIRFQPIEINRVFGEDTSYGLPID